MRDGQLTAGTTFPDSGSRRLFSWKQLGRPPNIESIRVEGRIQQRVIANLGRLEELQEGKLDRLIEGLTRYSKPQWVKLQANAKGHWVKWSKEWGPALIFRSSMGATWPII